MKRLLDIGRRWVFVLGVTGAVSGVAITSGSFVRAQEPDPADVAAGMRIFRQKADCQTCHGWAGDGRKMDTQMPDGANLRTTRLPRAGIVMAIKCGRPGRSMPAFDKFAYSDGRCNNLKASKTPEQAGLQLIAVPFTPTYAEYIYLKGRRVLADQMEYLLAHFPRSSPLHARLKAQAVQ